VARGVPDGADVEAAVAAMPEVRHLYVVECDEGVDTLCGKALPWHVDEITEHVNETTCLDCLNAMAAKGRECERRVAVLYADAMRRIQLSLLD
jgi:hypothetical protein